MDILATAINEYITTFSGYFSNFFIWGQWLFYSLLTLNIVWLCLWYAFDKNSCIESMPNFIKQFFIIALFYTIMTHHEWIIALLQTMHFMGKTLTGIPLDPIAIVANGITIANKILAPAQQASLVTTGLGLFIIFTTWLVVTFSFVTIALYLSVTLIITTAIMSIAAFFFGFVALGATSTIARRALDMVLVNCVRLLGIYITVGVGAKTISNIFSVIPNKLASFDAYTWVIAMCLLFWMVAKHLPLQLAKIVADCVQDMRENNTASTAINTTAIATTAAATTSAATAAAAEISGLADIAHQAPQYVAGQFEQAVARQNIGMGVGGIAAARNNIQRDKQK